MPEPIVQTPEVDPPKVETTPGTETVEEVDYKTKFVESQKEALRLKTLYDATQVQNPPVVPEDEKKIKDVIAQTKKEEGELAEKAEQQLRKELDDLHTIYGDFDEKKLQSIVDRYGVYNDKGDVNWYGAMELYEKISGDVPTEAPKPKVPTSKREGANPQTEVDTPVDVSKMSMADAISKGLKKFGL